jgi:hypothetical protein
LRKRRRRWRRRRRRRRRIVMKIPQWIPWKLDKFPFPMSAAQHAPKSVTTAVCPFHYAQWGKREREMKHT